ncbi:rhomboid family intramembrane serine protease [Marinobacteraceae bacterium S3BR75-40.1]
MLVIPVERQIDWKRPPWITLALILINFCVFVFYQGDDEQLLTAALQQYQEAGLLEQEAPVYESYLQREVNLHGADAVDQLQRVRQAMEQNDKVWLAVNMLMDDGFYRYARENGELYWQVGEFAAWKEARAEIQTHYLDRLSARAFGLIPDDIEPADLIAYQFLHGNWAHLIGNMVFLFLLGFTVERALGGPRFLLAYLLCGVASGLAHAGMAWGSNVALVGASGSISGLMGMYVAIFGRQSIRFFYFLGFYMGYFRAPALAMLPLWIGKELYDYWAAGATGIAYMAHAGGLAAGAGLVWLFGKSWLQVKEEFFDPTEMEQEQQFRRQYGQAMADLAHFEFERARLQFEALHKRYPERLVLLEHLYHLAKLKPDSAAYRERTQQMLEFCLRTNQSERLFTLWDEFLRLSPDPHGLGPEAHNKILFAALRSGDLKVAEKAFDRLRQTDATILKEEACRLLITEFEKREMKSKVRQYRELLEQWVPPGTQAL